MGIRASRAPATRQKCLAAAFALAAAKGIGGCSRRDTEPAQLERLGSDPAAAVSREPATAETASQPTTFFLEPYVAISDEMVAAARWLEALRARDAAALALTTSQTFEWLGTGGQRCSAKQPAATAREVATILDCLLAHDVLLRVLNDHRRAGIESVPSGRLQEWAEPWRARAPSGAVLVNAFIKRDDAQLDVYLWVAQGKVQAVWTDLRDGTAAASIAQRWLDALRKRDLDALAQVTTYPFEVRDSGREALCRSSSARAPEELHAAVRCLLNSAELHRAFETRLPSVRASLDDNPVPNWAEQWWNRAVHGGLSRTSAALSTPEGASFDIILMVGADGVRAVWKYGTLEARD